MSPCRRVKDRGDSAVRRSVDRAAAGDRGLDGVQRRSADGVAALAGHRHRSGLHRRVIGGRALAAQSLVPDPGCVQGTRGDDGGCLAGGTGRGAVDAGGWVVDGDGGVSGRCAAVRIHLPPSDRSGHRAVSRDSAGAVLPRRRHEPGPARGCGGLAADRCRRAGLDGGQGRVHLRGGAADAQRPSPGAGPWRADGAGRRVRVRAVRCGIGFRGHRCTGQRQPDRDRGGVDGADAVVRAAAASADASRRRRWREWKQSMARPAAC